MQQVIQIHTDEEGLRVLASELDRLQQKWNFPQKTKLELNLILDELITNIIEHGEGCKKRPIEIHLEKFDSRFEVQVIDGGPSFDPTIREPIDPALPLEKRSCGGLGLHLVRKFCHCCHYSRVDGKNVLRFTKTY